MDLWTFHQFKQPCLCIDEIDQDEASAVLKLKSGPHTYRLAFDDFEAAAQIGTQLSTLRHSDAPLWSTLRESPEDSSWYTLANFLDTHSLIREASDGAAESLRAQARIVEDCIAATANAILKRMNGDARAIASSHALSLRRKLRHVASTGGSFLDDGDPFDAVAQPNFFLALVAVECEYFRRFSPPTLAAASSLLGRIADENDGVLDLSVGASLSGASGLYDLHDLEAHLWLVGNCMILSASDDAARFDTSGFPDLALSSGLEFMRQTEILTRDTLVNWGENPYVTALDALGDAYSPLVAGPFIEQYHVTRRFVEIVAPLLSRRLSAALRGMMFRYFSEEVGHEALESTTCEALGVSPAALARAIPLPLHFAFVDALTVVADADPISSFAAIMVIEGIFGEPPKMSLRLAAVARKNPAFREISGDHDELNETLNHNSISRDAFENISAVNPAVQIRVMRRILFLLELNHRAWHGIAEFYGKQDELWLPGSFGTKLAPKG